ncbi:MAG: ABC transporter permease subunit, partial [Acetobacteraceae bacterium]|nr:ABC transporter permease subunit [Acetobacteraceae bacterium]
GILLLALLPIAALTAATLMTSWDIPAFRGFNFRGGFVLVPEFVALFAALTTYTAAFIAEIVRAGVLSVPKGQIEAADALGLSTFEKTRTIVMPLALRVIVPPLTSQYLNLVKNSSLAVAIGYQDIVSIADTTLNQTGQAIEGVAIIMGVYLTFSLSISTFMNWYNKRMALRER